jgi:hypothetical protein
MLEELDRELKSLFSAASLAHPLRPTGVESQGEDFPDIYVFRGRNVRFSYRLGGSNGELREIHSAMRRLLQHMNSVMGLLDENYHGLASHIIAGHVQRALETTKQIFAMLEAERYATSIPPSIPAPEHPKPR